ncbi:hypothetical protein SAMN05216410_1245 [Sanguibacter gelidistatuariae]|uniref:Uncharacterized protein n=1 Tax=Sanguibacter gelidistatuariae TaxID=1814289 RepID=A0A1G6HYF2_9MICO|nr:hypothetical protein SAMN05216410_1245 [Sanguibacter gelidistatuariae]
MSEREQYESDVVQQVTVGLVNVEVLVEQWLSHY